MYHRMHFLLYTKKVQYECCLLVGTNHQKEAIVGPKGQRNEINRVKVKNSHKES